MFAFASRPGLSEREAFALAEVLSLRRSLAADGAAAKIMTQARPNVDQGETSRDIALDNDELAALLGVLRDPGEESDAGRHLRLELLKELGVPVATSRTQTWLVQEQFVELADRLRAARLEEVAVSLETSNRFPGGSEAEVLGVLSSWLDEVNVDAFGRELIDLRHELDFDLVTAEYASE